jgi:hypothetical protein
MPAATALQTAATLYGKLIAITFSAIRPSNAASSAPVFAKVNNFSFQKK